MNRTIAVMLLLLPSMAFATATPTGDFVGDVVEDWESHPGGFPACYDLDSAEMCSEGGGIHGTSSWGYICSIFPYGGSRLMGNNGAGTTMTFDMPIEQFGGYWGTNSGSGETAEFTFYNAAGAVVGTGELTFSVCGEWSWAGWTFDEGVTSMRVDFAPTHLMSENLTYTFGEGMGGGVDLMLGGDCPGEATIDISGAAGGQFMIVVGDSLGSTTIPAGPCAGTDLGVEASVGTISRFGPVPDGDGDGLVSLSPRLPGGVCDQYFQVIDVTTCDVSGVESF